jgi:hypothetical protein
MSVKAQDRRRKALERLEAHPVTVFSEDWQSYVPGNLKGTAQGERIGRENLAGAKMALAKYEAECNTLRQRLSTA